MQPPVLFFQLQGSTLVGIIASRKNGSWRVMRDFSLNLEGNGDPAATASWEHRLREFCNAKETRLLESAVWLLRRDEYAVLRVDLPEGTAEETDSMLELELAERLPADLARISYGWEPVGTAEDGRQIIQVYWTTQERLAPVHAALQRAGMRLVGILPSLAIYRRLFVRSEAPISTVVVHATSHSYEFAGWDTRGVIVFSRAKQLADHSDGHDQPGTTADACLAELHERIQELAAAEPHSGDQPCQVNLMTLADGSAPEFSEQYPQLKAMGLALHEASQKLKALSPESGLPLLAVLELDGAFWGRSITGDLSSTVNMLPRQLVQQSEHAQVKRLTIQASMLIIGIVLLLAGNVWLYLYQINRYLTQNQDEIKRLTPAAKEVEAMEERIASIKGQLDYAIAPAGAIKQVNMVLSGSSDLLEGLYLDHMNYQATGEIVMEGHSVNDITPWQFAEELQKTGLFQILQQPRIELHMYGGTRSIRFSLKVQTKDRAAESTPASGAEKR